MLSRSDRRPLRPPLARGAVIGGAVGLALTGLLVLVPAARRQSFYEVGDALLVIGGALLVIATCVGAMVGLAVGQGEGRPAARRTRRRTAILVVAGLVACVLAGFMFFLWGAGLSDVLLPSGP